MIAVSLSAVSCNDDFLERYPLDQISNETFWVTQDDLENYNNGFYDAIRDNTKFDFLQGLRDNWDGGMWWTDQFSDNLAPTHDRSKNFLEVRSGKFTVSNKPRILGWDGWNLMRAVNFGLANYDRAKDVSADIRNRYIAEARLFRAMFYADKVSKFGDVIWFESPLNIDSEELFAPRTPRATVMEKVLADLDFACQHLPANWGKGENPGRVTKWVAYAMKSRICLFEGTWRKYHNLSDATNWLTKSAESSEYLMTNGGFKIYKTGKPTQDYRFMHWQTTQASNPEVIYWRKHISLINGHGSTRLFLNYNGGATKSFVEDFLCTDGKPITLSSDYKGDATIETVFENRDPRLRQCVLHPADHKPLNFARDTTRTYPRLIGMAGGGTNLSNTGYHVIKFWNWADDVLARGKQEVSPPCLRLGEVLLNFAEAKAELGTITQTDIDKSINLLRDRVGMPHLMLNPPMDPRYANDGISSLIVEIRRERRVELFLEGHRYNDLRRWKQGKYLAITDLGIRWDSEAIKRYAGAKVKSTMINGVPYIDVRQGTDFVPTFDENKHYLWPLPISALTMNPTLKQNPGWDK